MTLITHHLAFNATVVTPLLLDDQAGSSIRGAVVNGLLDKFCVNKALPTCTDCPLLRVCPVATLVAPMREDGEGSRGQLPRPYVVRPPAGERRQFEPGETLTFGMGLIGPVAQLFPYVFMAAQEIERSGLGRRLPQNNGRRGGLRIDSIAAVNPLSDAQQPLFQRGCPNVQLPGLPIAPSDVTAHAATLPADRLTLRFHTPLRLTVKRDGRPSLVHQFDLGIFFARLAWRLDQLAEAYGAGEAISNYQTLPTLVERVRVVNDSTRWIDVVSYSSRTRQRTPIGGLVGTVTLEGDLAPLRELLVWGSLIHVGKNAVKGDGWYTIASSL